MELKLSNESIVLILICTADLIYTLFLLTGNHATEANLFMGYWLRYGLGAFAVAKLVLTFFPIFLLEYARRLNPHFVKLMLQAAIIAYVGIYCGLYLFINILPVLGFR